MGPPTLGQEHMVHSSHYCYHRKKIEHTVQNPAIFKSGVLKEACFFQA